MSITVAVDAQADIGRIVGWVQQFELVDALGCWWHDKGFGEVSFYPVSIEQYARTVEYIASWEGETTATVAACTECCANA